MNASGCDSHMHTSETQVHPAFKVRRSAMYHSKWMVRGPIFSPSRLCLMESQWTHAPFVKHVQTLQALLDFSVNHSHQCPTKPVEFVHLLLDGKTVTLN